MPNIELLEKSIPVAPIRIAALEGCRNLAEEVDKKLVKFRKELAAKKQPVHSAGLLPDFFPGGVRMPTFRNRRR